MLPSSLEKGGGAFISRTNSNPLHSRMLCATLVEIGPVVLEKKLTVYRRTDRQTDERQQAIRKAHLSF